jgi:uncharacterized protein (DUF433 family)
MRQIALRASALPRYKVGMSVEEILIEWDYLTPAQVFSALAYYHDNQEEIDRVRQQNS